MSFGGNNLSGQHNQFEYPGQQSFRQQNPQAEMNSFGQYNNSQQYQSSRSQDDIDVYLKEALKKEISLRFMLGIYKLHAIQIKQDTHCNENNYAFEKIKNIQLRQQITDLESQNKQQVDGNKQKMLLLINSSQASNNKPENNLDRERQLDQREAYLIEKMKSLKFEEKKVRDNQTQSLLKGEEIKRALHQINQNKEQQTDQYDERLEDLIRRENNVKFLEEQLNSKINQYEEIIQDIKNQEQELDFRIKEIKFEPLNLLGSKEQLRQRLANMKKEIYENFIHYAENLPNQESQFKTDNNQFYILFQNWEENPQFLKRKSEILKNLEVQLLEERFKMEIVENYLKKEYEIMKKQKEDYAQLQQKQLMIQQYEQNLKQEGELLEQKQKNLEKKQLKFEKEISIHKQYSNLTQNNEPATSISQISQHVQFLFQNDQSKSNKYNQILKDLAEYNRLADNKQEITFRNRNSYNNNDDHGTVKSLEEENNCLRDELSDLKRRIVEYEQNENNQNYANNSQEDYNDQSNIDIQQLIRESKEKKSIIKFLELWLKMSSKKSKGQTQFLKTFFLYLWKLKCYNSAHFQKIDQIEYDPQAQSFLDYKWEQKASQLQRQNRFPIKKLSKKRKEYEMALMDYERKKFYQNRLSVLLNSILLRQRRAEKLHVVVAFHRFARNCFRLSANIPRQEIQGMIQQQQQQNRSQSQLSDTGVNIENIGKGAFNDALKWEKPSIKRDKSPISSQSSKNKTASLKSLNPKQIEEKLVKEMQSMLQKKIRKQQALCLIYSLTMKKEIQQMHAVSRAFATWRHTNIEAEKQLITRELNYVNYQIQERVFQDNLFKTKVKLQKTELDSKLSLLNELLSSIHQSVNNKN
ncbi:hypothetical protein ABPG72_018948 [Tetrahymena utriculariae]